MTSVDSLRTLPDVLRLRAREQGGRPAFAFLTAGEEPGDSLTYLRLDEDAEDRAAALRAAGLEGSPVVLVYPAGLEFVRTLFGCMYARVAAAPVQVPSRERGLERLRKIADDAGTTTVLTCKEVRDDLLARFGDSPHLAGLTLVATDDLPARPAVGAAPAPGPGDTALLQYTSGSTGDPKGVVVSHANFVHNVLETDALWPTEPDGVFVSWLPHFHDMGMLFGIIMPVWTGRPSYLMAPDAFVRRPMRWLEALSRYRGTHAAAPSFAYEMCVREAERTGVDPELDLSSWRIAVNGAEPVRWPVVEAFARAFAPAGFRPQAMCPAYGLAENTLKATGSRPGDLPTVLRVDPDALREDTVRLAAPGEAAQPLVGVGVTVLDAGLRIVDPATRRERAEREVGEIWLSGPGVAGGYHHRPAETAEVFDARTDGGPDDGPHLRTGDLGFLHRGELFVTGRLKDVIIRKGRNFYPQDIEVQVEGTDGGLHPNCSAAFSVDDGTNERLVVVVEADGRVLRGTDVPTLSRRIREAVHEGQRLHVDDVVVVRRGSLPKTSSGKVQRRACRARYLEGALSPAVGRAS
ncbi:fatty acyl-AMP ligase [Streptomyces phaeofaciens JCM 4814]|uniref:Acyl-CoA synthetase n=1 Tax=Streptomyces phaeofaciens TaxID=68254 RepID=A0A918H480_9ACTN|nr:fatty acyl-AMP ligase [Streptomyces phaeofaciens]GGT36263.1 acyl-CoA synthetase [Streptomyces phaeofaciens]